MKKLVITATALGLAVSSSFAQGFFNFDNSALYSSTSVSPFLITIAPASDGIASGEGNGGQVIGSDPTFATPNYDISYLWMLGTANSGSFLDPSTFMAAGATNGITATFLGPTGNAAAGAGIVTAGTVHPTGSSGSPDGTLITIQLIAWYDATGSTTFSQALNVNTGWSQLETIRLAAGFDTTVADISTIPGFDVLVGPEPSIYALSGMAAAVMWVCRKKLSFRRS